MEITTFNKETGELGAVRTGSSLDLLTRHIRDGQGYVHGRHDPRTHHVNLKTGRVNKKRGKA